MSEPDPALLRSETHEIHISPPPPVKASSFAIVRTLPYGPKDSPSVRHTDALPQSLDPQVCERDL